MSNTTSTLQPSRRNSRTISKRKPLKSLKSGRPPTLPSLSSTQNKTTSTTTDTTTNTTSTSNPATTIKGKSSKRTRTLIRAHHNLHKARSKAVAANNHDLITSIDAQIAELGGLTAYQSASLTGQQKQRGGDSSKVLVEWLVELGLITLGKTMSRERRSRKVSEGSKGFLAANTASHDSGDDDNNNEEDEDEEEEETDFDPKTPQIQNDKSIVNNTKSKTISKSQSQTQSQYRGLRVLEIGSLSSQNAISSLLPPTTSSSSLSVNPDKPPNSRDKGIETVKRIDLKSQEPNLIQEIDFMHFPIPSDNEEKYDVVSLSLVLNYVGDPKGRGDMLLRTREFLRRRYHYCCRWDHDRNRGGDGSEDRNQKQESGEEEDMENSDYGHNHDAGIYDRDGELDLSTTSPPLNHNHNHNREQRNKISPHTSTTATTNTNNNNNNKRNKNSKNQEILPLLFIVLPLPCLTNSRYLTPNRFKELMSSIGYELVRERQSAKLYYSLFKWDCSSLEIDNAFGVRSEEEDKEREDGKDKKNEMEGRNDKRKRKERDRVRFGKVEVNPGKVRNNFCVVVE